MTTNYQEAIKAWSYEDGKVKLAKDFSESPLVKKAIVQTVEDYIDDIECKDGTAFAIARQCSEIACYSFKIRGRDPDETAGIVEALALGLLKLVPIRSKRKFRT